MSLKLNSSGGGSVTLQEPTTASDVTLSLPAATGTVVYENASGNVGIGTSSPTVYGTYKTLEVRGTGGGLLQFGTGTTTAAYIFQDGTNAGFNNISNGVITFGTNNTERARIDSSGNLLVGKTSSDLTTPGFGVDIRSGVLNGVSIIKNDNNWGTALFIRRNTGVGTGAVAEFNYNGTTTGTIGITTTTTAYNTSSDYRLKHDIQPMTGALAKVAALKPVTYKWNADDSAGEGFIAHELAEVVPDCVSGEKDAVDADGNPVYQGIDTSFLVATIVAAMKEQQQMIETLQAKVAALEAQ